MKDHVLVTMAGGNALDLSTMSNFEAGVAALTLIDRVYPGIRWKDLPGLAAGIRPETLGWNPFRAAYKAAGAIKDGVGDVLKSTGDYAGDAFGSTVRLFTDEKVIDGASRIGAAYATQGGSEGVKQLFGGGGGYGGLAHAGESVLEFISSLGAKAKENDSGGGGASNVLPWAIGGGAVLVLLVAALKR